MPDPTVVILAAGEGSRMQSDTVKVLHPICGRPMVLWPVLAAREAGAARIVVVDGPARRLDAVLPEGVVSAVQAEPRGTGDAVKAAAEHFGPDDATVVVLAGDVPLITAEAIGAIVRAHEGTRAAATMVTMALDDPTGYGRVVRAPDGTVERVVETKSPGDATSEQLAIHEVNTGIFAFDAGPLRAALEQVRADNAQGEYYLPDTLPALRAMGHAVAAHVIADETLTLGVNDRSDLARVRAHAQARIHRAHALNGVTVVDPASTTIDAEVTIGRDTLVEPGTHLRGSTRIGERARVGPLAVIADSVVEDDAIVVQSHLQGAHVGPGATAGPFAYLRPAAHLHAGAKAGTFVEIKNSEIGEGAKVPHLSYVGDADVGARSNLGAGTITANYDGRDKHRTTIGEGVRISVDTALVAPVTVGDGAYTAAGSVITEDVPPGALGVARSRQTNVEGYADRREQRP